MENQERQAPVDPRAYRAAMGVLPKGVTVIAAGAGADVHAMTASAVNSLSLEPLLVMFCLGKKAHMVAHIQREQGFSINVLRAGQRDLSTYFAGLWKRVTPPPFEFVPWIGGPLLKDCAAAVGCELHQMVEGGDHWIVIGRVIAVQQGAAPVEPLVIYQGSYRELTREARVGREDDGLWAFPW